MRLLILVCIAGLAALGCGADVDERIADARKLLEEQRTGGAIDLLRGVIEEEPDNGQANFLLGSALLQRGDKSGAIFPLRRAAAFEETAVDAGIPLARILAQTQNLEEADVAASEVLKRQPDNTEALGIRAHVRLSLTRYDEALADIDHRLKLSPDDATLHFVRAQTLMSAKRYDEAREGLARSESLFRDNGDLASAAQSCANVGAVFERSDGDLKRAGVQVERCLETYPTQLPVLKAAAGLYNTEGKPDRAVEVLRRAVAAAPESVEIRTAFAEQLYAAGHREDAVKEARQTVDDFGSLQAWVMLAELQIRTGDLKGADAALEKAASLASDPDAIRFRRADVLVSQGELDAAEALGAELTDPAFQAFVRGRVQLRRGDAAAALVSFEKGLERWPNNAAARAEAGAAAQQLGEMERALGHYREGARADAASNNAGLAGAVVAYSLGRYDEAFALASAHVRAHPYEGPDAYQIGIRAAYAAGMEQQVEVLLGGLEARGERGLAAAERARQVGAKGGAAAIEAMIAKVPLELGDPRSEPGLRALVDAQLAQQKKAEALAAVDAALRRDADRASLHDLRGRVLLTLDRTDEARREFEKAIALQESYGPAHTGLAMVAARAGDHEAALREFDSALSAAVPDPESAYQAARLLLANGRLDEARKRLEEITRRLPDHAQAANDLAWILAERKENLDHAKRLAELAVREHPSADTTDTLAWVEIQRGELDAARATLEQGLAAHPEHPTLLYRLGLAKRAGGDREGALAAFRDALQTGAFPQAEATQAEIAGLENEKGDKR